jgi:NitT/TauT family transport system permease protein
MNPLGRKNFLKTRTIRLISDNYRSILVIIGFFLVWELSVHIFRIPKIILPAVSETLAAIFFPKVHQTYHWAVNFKTTLTEFVLAFLVTSALGILIAIIVVWSRHIKNIVLPMFIFINSLPVIAIAPLILLWKGYGITTNMLIAFLVSFFPVVVNTMTGLDAVEDEILDLARYLNASKYQLFVKIRIPNSLPYIFSGLKICATMSIIGAIVAEYIGSNKGLGFVIINAQYTLDTPPIFASVILVSLMGAGLYGIVTLFERLLMPWAFVKERG